VPAVEVDSEASVDQEIYLPGDEATATATGFGAAEQVQLVLFSSPALIGTFTADPTGTVTAGFSVSQELPPGTHIAQFTGWCGRIATVDVVVGSPGVPAPVQPRRSSSPLWWLWALLAALAVGIGVWRWIVWRRRRDEEDLEDDEDEDDDELDPAFAVFGGVDAGIARGGPTAQEPVADEAGGGGPDGFAPWPAPGRDAP
jgi:hypothetical protein